jgi:ankyrin repeat protein
MSTQDLHGACKLGDINIIKLAFDSNPEKINEKDTQVKNIQLGWSPLYRTVISGQIDAARFLLEQGADPNMSNNLGETPLHQAADNGNSDMAKLLLNFGAQANYQQNEGDTPLHHSAFRGDSEMIELLLEARASPNIRNKVVRFI